MSIHPNVILLCRLTPHGLSRKTMKDICGPIDDDDDVTIGTKNYHRKVLEDDYDNDMQIGGKEGDLLFYDLVTYGYGEEIKWDDLVNQKDELDLWAKNTCKVHHCDYEIVVTANYW
jgi:hypothetical protein